MNKQDLDLLNKLTKWNRAYRSGEASVDDKTYDDQRSVFAEKYPDHPFVVGIEPAPVASSRKQKLPVPMRSMFKIKTLEELHKWLTKNKIPESNLIAIGPKFDGGSLLDDSSTGAAWTRGGDANEGQRSDKHLSVMNKLNKGPLGLTGGEVIISRLNWEKHWKGQINPRDGKEYKTLRGTVLGLFNNDTPDPKLEWVDYIRYYSPDMEMGNFMDMIDALNEINRVGIPQYYVRGKDITDKLMNDLYTEWNELYEIDGLIINIISAKNRQRLGRDERTGNPNYAIAYKGDFEERVDTKVQSVNCVVSKQGFLKPTVALDKVILSGAEVENPTGYNMKWIIDHHIAEGSIITVKRSGEVIPKIIDTLSHDEAKVAEMIESFEDCPACGEPTKWNDSHVELMCANEKCCGRKLAEIVSFFEILNFEEFGKSAIEKLYNAGYQSVNDILKITHKEIVEVDGLGDSTATKLLSQVDELKRGSKPLATIMHASGFFTGLGSTKLQLILDNLEFDFIEDLFSSFDQENDTPVIMALGETVKGLAEKTLKIFVENIDGFMDWYLEDQLIAEKYIQTPSTEVSGDSCKGFVVCFSGIRDVALQAFISGEGGEVKNSYSKKVTHLVVADPNSTSSKVVKAKKDGCLVLTVEQFKSL